ncbi:MAG TPA: FAD-dependent monooxygenase [Thermoanaerobaculia bacterium]|nr:FAD-dependent monooxygenase [Thermoanaerobaculia bacterium]
MARKHETEALVVGAGPVGMLAALALAERDVKVEVVDEEWRAAARSYALALHPASLELLDEVGLATELVEQGHRLTRIAFYDRGERRAEVYPAELPRAFPFLLVLPQKALEAALERRLERHGVKVRWNQRLASLALGGERPVATVERLAKESTGYSVATTVWVVEGETATAADFVVGTDGHRSVVRQALGAGLETLGEPELYAVFELASDAPELDEVRVVLDEQGTSVLWPLGRGRFRWSFQLDASTVEVDRPDKSRLAVQVGRHAYPFLSRDDLAALIARRAPWFEGSIGDLEWSVAVRFERRLAESFGRDGAWLAGDAAHLAPPVGVHSMNGGLAEANDLASRIARVLRRGSSRDLLESYGRERHAEWRRLLGARVEAGPEASDWVRERAGRIVPCLPGLGADLDRLAGQLGLRLR